MWIIGPGDVIDRRYRLERELGAGGMAYVFAALDEELGESIALKVIRPDLVSDPDLVERFKREVRIARQIHHPNVVRIFEFGRSELAGRELYYMTMELLSGVDLKQYRPRSVAEILKLGVQICDGLEAAHQVGVVHRDIKPQNVFVDEEGRARVMDFGISRLVTLTDLTRGSQSMGTPHYMSPEQVNGSKELDHRSDIYSVGVVLYELATGRVPFDGKTPVEVAVRHLQETPAEPRRINPRVPIGLERVILTCLSKFPARRYGSAAELRGELDRLSRELEKDTIWVDVRSPPGSESSEIGADGDGRDVSSEELVTTRRAEKEARKLPVARYAVGAAGLVLAVGAYFTLARRSPEPIPQPEVEVDVPPPPPETASVTASATTSVTTSAALVPVRQAPPAPATTTAAVVTPVASMAPLPARFSANPGTEIYIDGERAGVVPPVVEVALVPGPHRVRYRIPDYDELETEIEVRAGAENSFSHRFAPYGVLRILAQPYARVELDGKDLGFTPVNLSKAREGEHRLVLRREGFEPIETAISVKAGEINLHRFELKR